MMRNETNRGSCEKNQTDGEEKNRPEVVSKIAPRREQSSREQKWRKKKQEDEVGIDFDFWKSRHQPEQKSAENEQDWIRNAKFAREERKRGDRDQAKDKQFDDIRHAGMQKQGGAV